jgi:hypothetical protein
MPKERFIDSHLFQSFQRILRLEYELSEEGWDSQRAWYLVG